MNWDFVLSEPLWLSWTLENFGAYCARGANGDPTLLRHQYLHAVDSLPPLLTAHAAHHAELSVIATTLTSPSTDFETASAALERWRDLATGGERWSEAREWEEIVALEIAGPNPVIEEEEEEVRPKRRGKR